MNAAIFLHTSLALIPMGLAGLALGLVYFHLLRRTVDALGAAAGWRRPLLFSVARVGGAVLLFGLVTHFGAPALLATFAGFLVARWLALRQSRRAG